MSRPALVPADLDTIRHHLGKGVGERTVAGWFGVSVPRMLDALIKDEERREAEALAQRSVVNPASSFCEKRRRREPTEIEAFLLRSRSRMYWWAMKLTHNAASAEDLLSATYVRAIERQHKFEPGTNAAGWLSVMMRNLWINDIRRQIHLGSSGIALDVDEVG